MKLKQITFALLAGLLLCACKEEDPGIPTPTTTSNEYTIGDKTATIGSVVKYDYEGYYVFALYEQKGITENAKGQAMEIYINPSVLGQELDLATVTESGDAFLDIKGIDTPTGTLEVTWDETQSKVLIRLNAEEDGTVYKAYYNGEVVTYIDLQNQYLIGDAVNPIGSVVELKTEEGGHNFYLYEQEGITTLLDNPAPVMEIFVAEDFMSKEIDLATVSPQQASLSVKTWENTQWTGTLTVKPLGTENLNITLKAISQEGVEVRVNYSAKYSTTYVANNPHFTTTAEGVPTEYGAIPSVLRQVASGQAGYAFTDIQVATAKECRDAKVGVWFTVGATTEGTVELDKTADFKFIDYLNNKVYDKTNSEVTGGKITIKKATDGKVYFSLENVTLKRDKAANITIDAEYFGEVIETTDLELVLPLPDPGFYYYNQDGKLNASAPIDVVTCTTNTKGQYEFTFGSSDPDVYISTWPKLTVSPDLVNAGVIDCSNLPINSFKIVYNTFQLESLSDNEYKNPYIAVPTNGTLEITRDDAGNYTINFDMQNYYIKSSYGSDVQGDPSRLVIYYTGAVTEQ